MTMIFHIVLVAAFWAHALAYDLASRSNRVRFPNHEPPPFLITSDTLYEAAASQDAPSSVAVVKNYQNNPQPFPSVHHPTSHPGPAGPSGGPGPYGGVQPKGPHNLYDGPPRPQIYHPFSSHPPRPDNHPIKSHHHNAHTHQSNVNSPSSHNYLKSPDRYVPPGHSPLSKNLPVNGKPPQAPPQKQLFKPTNYRQNPPPYGNRDEPHRPPSHSPGKLNGPRDENASSDYSSFENFSGPTSSSFEHFGPPRGQGGGGGGDDDGGSGARPYPQPQRSPNNDYFKNQPSRFPPAQKGPQYDFDVPSGFNKFGGSQEFNGPSPSASGLEDSSEEFPEFDQLRSKWKLSFNEPSNEGFVKKKRPPQDVEETKQHYFKQGFKGGSFSYEDDSSDFEHHNGPSSLHSSSSHKSESDFFNSALKPSGLKRKEKPNKVNDYFDFSDMSDFGDFKSSSSDNFKFGSFDFNDFPSGGKKKQSHGGVPFSGSEWVPINVPKGGESSLKAYDIPSLESVAKQFNFPSAEVGGNEYTRSSEYPRPTRNRVTSGSNIVYGGRKQLTGGNEGVVSASLTVKQ